MEDDDESTDSEFELDLDVEDGISVQVQDELSKYLSKNKTMVKKLDPKVRDFLGMCTKCVYCVLTVTYNFFYTML